MLAHLPPELHLCILEFADARAVCAYRLVVRVPWSARWLWKTAPLRMRGTFGEVCCVASCGAPSATHVWWGEPGPLAHYLSRAPYCAQHAREWDLFCTSAFRCMGRYGLEEH